VTIVALTVFMLLFGGAPRYSEVALRIRRTAGGYVTGALFIALVGGVVTGVTTALLGVPYFLPLGFVMAIVGVVPFIGSVVGGTLVVSATFLASGIKAGFIALAVFLVYQQVENHVLQPLVQRKTIRMSPLVIAVVMLVGTALWGVVGALLSLPIAGTIQVILEERLARRQASWSSPGRPLPTSGAAPPH
jgi:putative heme transporter